MLVRKFGGVVESRWEFICMRGNEEKGLMSSDLGAQLANGLAEVRNTNDGARSVAFLGMDTPQMPVNELCLSFETMNTAGPNSIKPGFISPSEDGGATLIGVPEGASPAVFEGVRWSATDNCISLMGTFGREGIPVREGGKCIGTISGPYYYYLLYCSLGAGTFTDVDEIEDALTLAKYLNELNNQGQVANPNDGCPRVWAAFMKEGVVFPDGTTKPLSRL
jgi:hypothetical protein